MTNIFISWSGERSKKIAEELHTWIPSVLQFAKPYFTPNDIEKGSKWATEISKKLSETHVGIICLTKDNIEKPWILFEAGALSKDLDKSKVCSVIFGMDNSDLSGPLTTFQTTSFDKADFKKLMNAINDAGGNRMLSAETFNNVFEMWWPKLKDKIDKILENDPAEINKEVRTERELLEEILDLSRLNARRMANGQRSMRMMPVGWIKDFLESLETLINLYEKDDEKAAYLPIKSQMELFDYVINTDPSTDAKYQEQFYFLRNRFDNIVPF